jgi:hypothetical protein
VLAYLWRWWRGLGLGGVILRRRSDVAFPLLALGRMDVGAAVIAQWCDEAALCKQEFGLVHTTEADVWVIRL